MADAETILRQCKLETPPVAIFKENDSRIKILNHDKNKGLGAARNTALSASKGKYIVCVDSDDWVEPEFLAKIHTAFEKNDVVIAEFKQKVPVAAGKYTLSFSWITKGVAFWIQKKYPFYREMIFLARVKAFMCKSHRTLPATGGKSIPTILLKSPIFFREKEYT